MTKHRLFLTAILAMGAVSLPAQNSAPTRPTKRAPVESATDRQIRELREQLESQQSQINTLKQQLADKDAVLTTTTQSAQAANAQAAAATAQAESLSSSVQENKQAVTTLSSTVDDLKLTSTGLAQTVSDAKKDISDRLDSPLTLRYKGIQITPIAFFAFEGVWRQRAMNSDINTPFNSIPFMGANQAHVTELNFSGRQSRVGGLFVGDAGPFKLTGYVEIGRASCRERV